MIQQAIPPTETPIDAISALSSLLSLLNPLVSKLIFWTKGRRYKELKREKIGPFVKEIVVSVKNRMGMDSDSDGIIENCHCIGAAHAPE